MSTIVRIPPDGVPAEFEFEVPAPGELTTLGGVKLYFSFEQDRPSFGDFFPRLYLDGERATLSDSAMGPLSYTKVCRFDESVPAPAQMKVTLNEEGALKVGNTVHIYAWGAQTESGTGALNPDEGDQPSILTDTIEVGVIEVMTWQEWRRLNDGNRSTAVEGS